MKAGRASLFTLAFLAALSSFVRGSSLEAEHEPLRPIAEEAALLEQGRTTAQQRALVRLGLQPDPAADKVLRAQLDRYRSGQLPPALWLELFEAIGKRSDPALKAAFAETWARLEKSPDPLATFHQCLRGGDPEAGREIFTKKPQAGCTRCHSIDGQGGQIGPDLTWLRHFMERLHILESIILPNATIADGYASALLKLESGEEIAGVLTGENGHDVTVTTVADGKKRKILVAEIVERTPLPSPMPPHFGMVLSKREIRDLVEFLAEGD